MTDNIIHFSKYKNISPNGEHIYTDPDGVLWYEYACNYKDETSEFCFNIWATSAEDAERRMNLIRQSGAIAGQIYETEHADVPWECCISCHKVILENEFKEQGGLCSSCFGE